MNDDISRIKEKIDVVDLISEYVQLKPAGINHKGLCPLHNEKSPSFMVNRERQSWHCFGCAKGGDIFTFVQEMEGMEFRDALRFLADKAGIQLSQTVSTTETTQKNRIKDINHEAAKFFHYILLKLDQSKPALDYLLTRGLTKETIEAWQIGFIPDQWDLLTKYLLKKGHSIDDILASGLAIKKDGADARSGRGYYDRFRGRIMFPIWDAHDTVVGFTGRVLVETEHSGGKYVNTPQTMLYDKSRVLFGLNKAKREIKAKDLIVMVEGQMDVIACHQAGMTNVVATSGTALTEHQVKLLKRYSVNVNMAFDSDAAGVSAAKRGIDLLIEDGMNVKVIQIPEGKGKDPDECIKENKDVWFESVAHAKDIMQWYFDRSFKEKILTDPKAKQQIANELLLEISRIPYAVERDHWLGTLSHRLQVDVSVLREDITRILQEQRKITPIRTVVKEERAPEVKVDRLVLLSNRFFALLSIDPSLTLKIPENFFMIDAFSTAVQQDLYETLKIAYTQRILCDFTHVREHYTQANAENPVDILLLMGEKEFSDFTADAREDELLILVSQIRSEWIKRKRSSVQNALAEAEAAGDSTQIETLLRSLQQFSE
ncbi:MAG TPA: DNA primase [Candidatus Magasanikbacteria bacterium]|nr:DNA primase [Candidatus Magasanikbacteria bacterium]